jgi:hypothetical protein
MSFRRDSNAHERWCRLVRENADLLADLPPEALVRENAFRDYVTRGVHRGVRFSPSVSELSRDALEKLALFIYHRTEFDMDVIRFDDFNEAIRRGPSNSVKR